METIGIFVTGAGIILSGLAGLFTLWLILYTLYLHSKGLVLQKYPKIHMTTPMARIPLSPDCTEYKRVRNFINIESGFNRCNRDDKIFKCPTIQYPMRYLVYSGNGNDKMEVYHEDGHWRYRTIIDWTEI